MEEEAGHRKTPGISRDALLCGSSSELPSLATVVSPPTSTIELLDTGYLYPAHHSHTLPSYQEEWRGTQIGAIGQQHFQQQKEEVPQWMYQGNHHKIKDASQPLRSLHSYCGTMYITTVQGNRLLSVK